MFVRFRILIVKQLHTTQIVTLYRNLSSFIELQTIAIRYHPLGKQTDVMKLILRKLRALEEERQLFIRIMKDIER